MTVLVDSNVVIDLLQNSQWADWAVARFEERPNDTFAVNQLIYAESSLSFLGVGINPPLATWGSLAAEGLVPTLNPINPRWWMLLFPCVLLVVTLLSLNFLGDGLRDVFDPKRDAAKL